MFDTYISNPPVRKVVTTTVHEHRAPTDRSIALADEMREKIERSFLAQVKMSNNIIKGTWSVFRLPEFYGTRIILRCEINGVVHQVHRELPESLAREDVTSAVKDLLGSIVERTLASTFNDVSEALFRCASPGGSMKGEP